MNLPLIDSFIELERAAADCFWKSENRTAWRDDLLRLRETANILPLKEQFISSEEHSVKQSFREAPVLMWDEDLLHCFTGCQLQKNEQEAFQHVIELLKTKHRNTLTGIFLRPGFWMNTSWTEQEAPLREALSSAKENGGFIMRCGFLTQPADILWTADLGFSGVQIHARGLDLFELQMAIELARDCRLSPVVSVSSPDELELVLQTDAPHIAICQLATPSKGTAFNLLSEALARIPKNCSRLLMTKAMTQNEIRLLLKQGFDAILFYTAIENISIAEK